MNILTSAIIIILLYIFIYKYLIVVIAPPKNVHNSVFFKAKRSNDGLFPKSQACS